MNFQKSLFNLPPIQYSIYQAIIFLQIHLSVCEQYTYFFKWLLADILEVQKSTLYCISHNFRQKLNFIVFKKFCFQNGAADSHFRLIIFGNSLLVIIFWKKKINKATCYHFGCLILIIHILHIYC